MTTRILTGTYGSGYTLKAGYTALLLSSSAELFGPNGAIAGSAGGVALSVPYVLPVSNSATLIDGGTGAEGVEFGGNNKSGTGGSGGDAVHLSGGTFTNAGAIFGGVGGSGAPGYGGGNGGAGGVALSLGAAGEVDSAHTITGGTGGAGGQGTFSGTGGAGGVALDFAADGAVSNSAGIVGGQGGAAGSRSTTLTGSYGAGGAGGIAIFMAGSGTITNSAGGFIYGGGGGSGGLDFVTAGAGGAAIWLVGGGTVINKANIHGGAGGTGADGGAGVYMAAAGYVSNAFGDLIDGGYAAASAQAGAGVQLAGGGTLANAGVVTGGYSRLGVSGNGAVFGAGGSLVNTGFIYGGTTTLGSPGCGVFMSGGDIDNQDFIRGGNASSGPQGVGVYIAAGTVTNGGSSSPMAFILGEIGVNTGDTQAVTVINAGTISGYYFSVELQNKADRLIVESGAMFEGKVAGYGVLELAGGAQTITGMGGAATMTGGAAMTMQGFSGYVVDADASLTLVGGNTLKAGDGQLVSYDALSLTAGANLVALNGAQVEVQDTVANNGTITLASGAANTDLRILAGGATLSAGATIDMTGNKARILGATAATLLTNVDNSIVGSGFVGANQMELVNEANGVIEALGGTLTVRTTGPSLVNAGALAAASGGTLVISDTTLANMGGMIQANSGAPVKLQNVVVRGGTVAAAGTGVVKVNLPGGELDGTTSAVSLSGFIHVVTTSNEILEGSITNAGKLNLTAGSKTCDLIIGAAGATLNGGGQVNLSNSLGNRIYGLAAGDKLTNVDNRIDGAGLLGKGTMTLVNEAGGQILGNQNLSLTIDTGAKTIVNAGLIENVGKGGTLVKSVVANTGTLKAATIGTLTLAGTVTGAGVGEINGGTLFVELAFAEKVTFTGTTGVLELGDSQAFTGKVAGLSKTGTNWLDLGDIGFFSAKTKATYSGTTASGTLAVTDGTHTAHITLLGDYIGQTFTVSSDGHGGTKVVDPSGAGAPLVQAMSALQHGPPVHIAGTAAYRLPRLPTWHVQA